MNVFLKLKYYLLVVVMVLTSCNNKKTDTTKTDFCSKLQRNDSLSLSKALAEFTPIMQDKTGVYVLEDGSGSMVARAWLTEYAEKTIDIQYFIFSTDNVGLIACDYLIKAADRGVQVRILVDDIMIEADAQDILTFNSHPNISVKIYNPGVNLGKNIFQKTGKFAINFKAANQRMHNKTFIVDDKVVITGGRNIADEYFDYDHEYNFRDRDILLIGKETKTVKTSFETFWNSALSIDVTNVIKDIPENILEENRFDNLHEYACNPENFWPQVRTRIENLPETFNTIKNSGDLVWLDQVRFISDLPGKNDGKNGLSGGGISTTALINLVKNAKSSIDIQTPYLITSKTSRALFKAAVNRGVNIRILTNSLSSTDNVEAFSGYQSSRKDLLKTGVRIFEFKPDAEERKKIMTGELQATLEYAPIFGLHAKSMVIDGKTTVIGTFNLDPRSANLNTECIVVVESKKISEGVLKGMNIEFKPENSWETTLDFNPDSEVSNYKRLKTWTRKVIPNSIL
ncbi:phospholipase D family protein [Algibacter pectinivorans]|uniref:Phosphatidylserine/phosphatidylglycerophosphate/cardiolipin synthase n=1 Tax=Algibacter pectinivorans TaxID=870482 RepID=A0A1I1Q3R7_9FLAO|nr:phospholipase D family protein [Algibacter pectinivorans]SFD16637.1 Phosphatidylserine/phosphatidylglycerophosphate/cardiolipin synthase [Algibacter pectinivorans]